MSGKDTGTTSRQGLGVGSVIAPQKNHQGFSKDSTVKRAARHVDELTSKDIKLPNKETSKEPEFNNPDFLSRK